MDRRDFLFAGLGYTTLGVAAGIGMGLGIPKLGGAKEDDPSAGPSGGGDAEGATPSESDDASAADSNEHDTTTSSATQEQREAVDLPFLVNPQVRHRLHGPARRPSR